MTGCLIGILVFTSLDQTSLSQWKQWQCQGRAVHRRYLNFAEGFSLAIPAGLVGRAGQAAGPERGVSIPLSVDCTAVVVVYGEPNSLEWQSPADAIKWNIDSTIEDDRHAHVHPFKARLGKLKAAGMTVRDSTTSDVNETIVAFRSAGGPVYTAILSTTAERYKRDHAIFKKLVLGFRLEDWR